MTTSGAGSPDARGKTVSVGGARPLLLFVVTEDWYFVSHRLPLAIAARQSGFDVAIATRIDRHGERLREAGLKVLPVAFDRSGLGPLTELRTIRDLARIYAAERPDIVHHVALKPVIYGAMAARWTRVPAVVNALGGLGYVFSNGAARARSMRALVRPALRLALAAPNAQLIVQNSEDRETIVAGKLAPAPRVHLIRGAGVDPLAHRPVAHDVDVPLVILPARLLREKGIAEFVAAARLLREKGTAARFALVGRPDPANPASATEAELRAWTADGAVEWWGWRDDMPAVFSAAQIVCLPTYYGEGLPKALLEGAASGCGLVASDIAGCREIVRDGETGWLVPTRDTAALATALEEAISDRGKRARLGANARDAVAREFSIDRVVAETLAIYRSLLAQRADAPQR